MTDFLSRRKKSVAPILVPEQCRAARGLLNLSQKSLADAAGVSRSTVRDFECKRHQLHRSTEEQIVETLVGMGVILLPADDQGPGVRLRATGRYSTGTG